MGNAKTTRITTANYNDNDYGFTALHEDQIVNDADLRVRHELSITKYEKKFDFIMTELDKLFTNLKKDSHKEFVHWPNRAEAIDKFMARLKSKIEEV